MAFAFAWRVLSVSLDAGGAVRGHRQFLRGLSKYLHGIESSQGRRRVTLVDLRSSMPKYIIERNIPGAGALDRRAVSRHYTNVVQRAERDGSADSMD